MKISGEAQNKTFKALQQDKAVRGGRAMPRIWYIVANKKNALIFREDGGHLQQIADITPDEENSTSSRRRTSGQMPAGSGKVYYTSNPMDRVQNFESDAFLANVTSWLLVAQQEKAFDRLVLAAAPEALGIIRMKMDAQLEEAVIHEINKDLVNMPLADLEAMLIGYGRKPH
jgi:protein required for attachment to host cells